MFLPGSGDAALAYTEFTRRRQNLPHAQAVDVYLLVYYSISYLYYSNSELMEIIVAIFLL